jgi:hypothetical protein
MAVIHYRPLSKGEGLQINGGRLRAMAGGEVHGETTLSETDQARGLDQLLASYRVPELLDELSFCHHPPARQLVLAISIDFSLPGIVFGHLRIDDGERQPWQAELTRSNAFLERRRVPEGARSWAEEDPPGAGWRIELPGPLALDPDPAVPQRSGLAIEALLYSLRSGREIELPYRRLLRTTFSADDPLWAVRLPLVTSVGGRG